MRHTALILLGGICAAANAITLPRTNVRQLIASPLERGETAVVEADGYAEMIVGGPSGPLRVKDPAALRGYRLRTLDKSEYSVAAGPAFVYDAAADKYTISQSGVTNQIVISVKGGLDVKDFNLSIEGVGEGLIPPSPWSHTEVDGSIARVDVALGQGCTAVVVSRISVKVREFGDVECVNDLDAVTFELLDPIGRYNLRDLRTWARDLYNGNRGEDWSKYKATHVVDLASKPVRVTSAGDFTWTVSTQTNLVLQVGRRDAMVFSSPQMATPIQYTYFRISSIDVSTSSATVMGFVTDIEDFNVANLGVIVSDSLDETVWLGLNEDDFTAVVDSQSGGVTSGTVTIPNGHKGNARFYRLTYGDAITDSVRIKLRGTVVVEDVLVIKGTDSKYYRIKVTGGTLSAEEVTL